MNSSFPSQPADRIEPRPGPGSTGNKKHQAHITGDDSQDDEGSDDEDDHDSVIIGSGDSSLEVNFLHPPALADHCFTELRDKVQWQKMYHRGGEVPRLVAVQAERATVDGDIPIYRHPADETPELGVPFDETVEKIRQAAEQMVAHPLNHVLIQRYRSGEDTISEHSDKTLDIVRGSKIVNVSLGTMRTMTLRTKVRQKQKQNQSHQKQHIRTPSVLLSDDNNNNDDHGNDGNDRNDKNTNNKRESQRIELPHNSIFILGPVTNQFWLHGIRPDRRQKSLSSKRISQRDKEDIFNGERISLTFRHIGTFITREEPRTRVRARTDKREDFEDFEHDDDDDDKNNDDEKWWIYGQGATSKTREQRKHLIIPPHHALLRGKAKEKRAKKEKDPGSDAEVGDEEVEKEEAKEIQEMIQAFGQENRQSQDWDWDLTYGQGWDVMI